MGGLRASRCRGAFIATARPLAVEGEEGGEGGVLGEVGGPAVGGGDGGVERGVQGVEPGALGCRGCCRGW